MEEQKAGLYEDVYNYILNQLFAQRLEFGQKIAEEEIAQTLGVSRTPIREALRKLESDGLVEIQPKRFAQIITLEREDVQQLGVVKLQLDFLTAQLAVFNGANAQFKELEEINEDLRNALAVGDMSKALRRDMEFHRAYIAISRNDVLIHCQAQLRLKIALYQSIRAKGNPKLMENSVQEHSAIIEALYQRDVSQVLHNIIRHISTFYGIDADVYSLMIADFSGGRARLPGDIETLYTHSK